MIQYNATKYKKYPKNNEGIALQRCKPCSAKELIDQRLKEGFFNKMNEIKAGKTRVKPLKKGDVYGDFTVLEDEPLRKIYTSSTGKRTIRALWTCQCKCGSITQRTTTDLITKQGIKKCTVCGYKERPQSTRRQSDIERLYNLSIVGRCKKSKDRIKNLLSLEDFKKLIKGNCFYCGQPPKEITLGKNKIVQNIKIVRNGIDRIDSTKHYSPDNCIPCCKYCNIVKSDLTQEQFFIKINEIYTHLQQKLITHHEISTK
jgi:hypothetical protein